MAVVLAAAASAAFSAAVPLVIQGGLAALFTSTALSTILTAAVGGALSALANGALSGGPDPVEQPSPSLLVRQPEIWGNFIYGHCRVQRSGLVFADDHGPHLWLVVPIACHEINRVVAVYNGDEMMFDGTSSVGEYAYPGETPIEIHVRTGTDDQTAVGELIDDFPELDENFRGRGIAYLAVKLIDFTYEDRNWNASLPQLWIEVEGAKVYDPRSATTAYSANTALCMNHYATAVRGGPGLTNIDQSWLITSANMCDEWVDDEGTFAATSNHIWPSQFVGGSWQHRRYELNGSFTSNQESGAILREMARYMSGKVIYTGGEYQFRAGGFSTPVATYGPSNVFDTPELSGAVRIEDQVAGMRGVYANPSANFQVDGYPEVAFAIPPVSGEAPNFGTSNFGRDIHPERAQRLAALEGRQTLRLAALTLALPLSAMAHEAGDGISYAQPDIGVDGIFEVQEVRLDIESDRPRVLLTTVEDNATFWAWQSGDASVVPEASPSTLADPRTVAPVASVIATSTTWLAPDGTVRPSLDVVWSASSHFFTSDYEVIWTVGGDVMGVARTAGSLRLRITSGINVADAVTVSVRAVNRLGFKSSPTTGVAVVDGDDAAPPTPVVIDVRAGHDLIELELNPSGVADFKEFVVWGASASSPTLTEVGRISGTVFSWYPGASGMTRYKVSAVDFSGNESPKTASFSEVVPVPASLADLDSDVQEAIDAAAGSASGDVAAAEAAALAAAVASAASAASAAAADASSIAAAGAQGLAEAAHDGAEAFKMASEAAQLAAESASSDAAASAVVAAAASAAAAVSEGSAAAASSTAEGHAASAATASELAVEISAGMASGNFFLNGTFASGVAAPWLPYSGAVLSVVPVSVAGVNADNRLRMSSPASGPDGWVVARTSAGIYANWGDRRVRWSCKARSNTVGVEFRQYYETTAAGGATANYWQGFTFTNTNWQTVVFETVLASDVVFVNFSMVGSGPTGVDFFVDVTELHGEDITSEAASASSAAASAASAASALVSEGAAGTSASAASSDALAASTSAGQASASAAAAVLSEAGAGGSAVLAASSAELSVRSSIASATGNLTDTPNGASGVGSWVAGHGGIVSSGTTADPLPSSKDYIALDALASDPDGIVTMFSNNNEYRVGDWGGRVLRFSFACRISALDVNIKALIYCRDGDGVSVGNASFLWDIGGGWQRLTQDVEITAGAAQILPSIQIVGPGSSARNVWFSDILIADVTSEVAAASAATASAGSAAAALISESAAGTAASAALLDAVAAGTSEANANASETLAAGYASTAAGYSVTAEAARDVAVKMLTRGWHHNPIFDDFSGARPAGWNSNTSEGTMENKPEWAKYNNAVLIETDPSPTLTFPNLWSWTDSADVDNARAGDFERVIVTIEIERVAGTFAGSFLSVVWYGANTRTVYFDVGANLSDQNNVVNKIEFLAERPSDWLPGGSNYISWAWTPNGFDGAAYNYKRVLIHSFDLQGVQADAMTSIWQKASVDVDQIASAIIGFRASAGGGGAELELVALSDPNGGTVSAARISADQIILDGSTKSRHMDIDGPLTISAGTGSFRFNKTSAEDPADGLFLGFDDGQAAFNFSKDDAGFEQSIKGNDEGLVISNAEFRVGAGTYPPYSDVTTSQVVTLNAAHDRLKFAMIGGGRGGQGYTASSPVVGAYGGATTVKVYDGATLKHTFTALGGAGFLAGFVGASTVYGPGGSSQDAPAGSYGAGGGAVDLTNPYAAYNAGGAGDYNIEVDIDISTYTTPKIDVTIGAGGAGGGTAGGSGNVKGGNGAAGIVQYSTTDAAPLKAQVHAVKPVTGSFVTSSAASDFPAAISGPGFLILRASSFNLDLGVVEISDDAADNITIDGVRMFSLPIQKRPRKQTGGSSQSILYWFYQS